MAQALNNSGSSGHSEMTMDHSINSNHYLDGMVDAPLKQDPYDKIEDAKDPEQIAQAERERKIQARGFQFGGYVSNSSHDQSSSSQQSRSPSLMSSVGGSPQVSQLPNKVDQARPLRFQKKISDDQKAQFFMQTVNSQDVAQSSSPDSARDAFMNRGNQEIQPMTLRNRRLERLENDSATFGYQHPSKAGNRSSGGLFADALKQNKCQVRRDCPNAAISQCVEQAYRGCTLNFCSEHSGQLNRRKNEIFCCRPCSRDKHEDICAECSNDLLQARSKFYIIALILSVLIFFVMMSLVHLVMQSMPNVCTNPAASESFCGSFNQVMHSLNPYTQQQPAKSFQTANKALHMFNQVDR